jgi:geranylgeranyl diphosphate synthase, type I
MAIDADALGVLLHAPAVDAAVRSAIGELARELETIDPGLAPAAATLVDAGAGGKRLRGALVRWAYAAHCGEDPRDVTGAAVAVELVHLSALVHDDVIDRSDLRRGRPSVHARAATEHPEPGTEAADEHGRSVAVLLGDVLLAAAGGPFMACRVAPDALSAAHRAFVRLQVEVMAGQYLDVDAAARRSADRERALRIATLKSGRYSVARPLELGALLAGMAPTSTGDLLAVGDALGVAFQLRDDLLGVFGDPEVTGKPAGSDLVEGKRTLLVAETLERLAGAERAGFDAALGSPSLDADGVAGLAATIERSGARAAVEARVDEAARSALEGIATLPIGPGQQAALRELAEWMTTRHH